MGALESCSPASEPRVSSRMPTGSRLCHKRGPVSSPLPIQHVKNFDFRLPQTLRCGRRLSKRSKLSRTTARQWKGCPSGRPFLFSAISTRGAKSCMPDLRTCCARVASSLIERGPHFHRRSRCVAEESHENLRKLHIVLQGDGDHRAEKADEQVVRVLRQGDRLQDLPYPSIRVPHVQLPVAQRRELSR